MIRRAFGAVLAAALLGPLVPAAGSAQVEPELTANAGWLSQYYYRGAPQKNSSANAGLDIAAGMFSAGTWAADVGDGSEIDVYAAFGTDLTEVVSLSLGGTGYFYTGDFDQTYLEANVGVGAGPVSLEWSFGRHDLLPAVPGDPEDEKYSFIALTAEHMGFFATVGSIAYAQEFGDAISDQFDEDLGGQYLEAGYGFEAAELDFTVSGIWSDSALSGQGNDELTLVFGVSKTFEIPLD